MKNRVINDSVNRITQHYGNGHNGVDLGWRTDESQNKVYANCKGVVYEIQTGIGNIPGATGVKSWGNYVLIKHPNGMFTRYAHLQEIYVSVNQEVNENSCIGLIGNTGNSRGRHLHFEVAKGYSSSTRINPEPYLDKAVYSENRLKYRTYDNVKNKWLPEVEIGDGGYAGNFGDSVGGIQARLSNDSRITIQSHILNSGWLSPITKWDDTSNGYSGIKGKSIDAVMIKADNYKIEYRVHLKNSNRWLGWVNGFDKNDYKNGYAGNIGEAIDAIQIRVV